MINIFIIIVLFFHNIFDNFPYFFFHSLLIFSSQYQVYASALKKWKNLLLSAYVHESVLTQARAVHSGRAVLYFFSKIQFQISVKKENCKIHFDADIYGKRKSLKCAFSCLLQNVQSQRKFSENRDFLIFEKVRIEAMREMTLRENGNENNLIFVSNNNFESNYRDNGDENHKKISDNNDNSNYNNNNKSNRNRSSLSPPISPSKKNKKIFLNKFPFFIIAPYFRFWRTRILFLATNKRIVLTEFDGWKKR